MGWVDEAIGKSVCRGWKGGYNQALDTGKTGPSTQPRLGGVSEEEEEMALVRKPGPGEPGPEVGKPLASPTFWFFPEWRGSCTQ